MQVGIFAKTFLRPTLDHVLDAVRAAGLDCIQFNMVCAGLASLPDLIDPSLRQTIRDALSQRSITMAAVSGTYNMAHPDPQQRSEGLKRLEILAGACRDLGTSVITLCTGTRDPENMWRRHPANDSPEAWHDMAESVGQALAIAEEHRVTLGIEPEVSNIVNSTIKARQLLDDMRSPQLKIVMDGANLFPAGTIGRIREILTEAFDLLGGDIILTHAKDLSRDGEAGNLPAGQGLLDYDLYLSLLREASFDGPLILHGLQEQEVVSSVRFVKEKLAAASSREGEVPAEPQILDQEARQELRPPIQMTSRMPFFARDGINFHYRQVGDGLPFVFQHGLGGDLEQPFGLFRPPAGVRMLAIDSRGHGLTQPLGEESHFTIASFADDVVACLDHLGIATAVVGGISMGAAVALNLAVRYSERTLGLVLARPAWVIEAGPENLGILAVVVRFIREHGAQRGKELFQKSEEYEAMAAESPACAQSLLGQFDGPRAAEAVVRLARIPADTPVRDPAALAAIAVPVLVLANRRDPIHPFGYGQTLTETIPSARFAELTPKSVDEARHTADVQEQVGRFLEQLNFNADTLLVPR